ncbi:MAG: TonB-dependent receptor [Paludibacteraceae bacterium]|nr:TonB-dependent receptor [Paludibacteraceae bacterium]
MKKLCYIGLLSIATCNIFAAEPAQDSLLLKEVVINAPKEAISLREQPTASYSLNIQRIENEQINSLKDISLNVPNFYIPDYGSKLTSSIYVRGISSRMNEPSVGLYVDDIPYLDKSCFDFDFYDLQSIILLQGPQGTLYGRNAIAGLVNMYTVSPLSYQGTRVSLSYGNYNDFQAKLSHYHKFSDKVGLSVAGYYKSNDGYFTNSYNGDKNSSKSAGGRAKLDWQLSKKWKAGVSVAYDHSDQKAYPYAQYDTLTQKAKDVNYNDESSYLRDMVSAGLSIQRSSKNVLFTSATGYQYLTDRMKIDQDFTPSPIFSLTQKQKEQIVTQEFVLRSKNNKPYQWVTGAFGFYKNLDINSPMLFESAGMAMMLPFSSDPEVTVPGEFKTPTWGAAIYHQSTYNFKNGFSVTAGLRYDYESVKIDYNTSETFDIYGMPRPLTYSLVGSSSKSFNQLLPKVALKYDFNNRSNVYASVTKGYKAGGYNYAMFSNLLGETNTDVNAVTYYKPETSWDYEIGTHNEIVKNKLYVDASVFYIDDRNQQLVTSTSEGSRVITNADKVQSYGLETNVRVNITHNLSATAAYGFTHSTFKDYTDTVNKINYNKKYVPFAPQNTLSLGLSYGLNVNTSWLDKVVFSAQYTGVGKIYWDEANSLYQDFYGLLNGQISFVKKSFQLTGWIKNALDKDYNTFYFESLGKSFVQKGKPMTFGVSANYSF